MLKTDSRAVGERKDQSPRRSKQSVLFVSVTLTRCHALKLLRINAENEKNKIKCSKKISAIDIHLELS
jgi:hypothetical protein